MAEAEAFETDFWKDANLRKAWDDIVPGEPRKTIPYTLTRDAIELYCKSVGEDHPIYFDEAYARTTRYGGLIAPPSIHILLMFSCTPADDWMRSPGTVNAGQSWSYNIPARPNDVITLAMGQAASMGQFLLCAGTAGKRFALPHARIMSCRSRPPSSLFCESSAWRKKRSPSSRIGRRWTK